VPCSVKVVAGGAAEITSTVVPSALPKVCRDARCDDEALIDRM
jgi:hypothetical protein